MEPTTTTLPQSAMWSLMIVVAISPPTCDSITCKSYLRHWGLAKIAAILQTTFLNAFSWMKTFEFKIKFHWNMLFGFNWQYVNIGSDNGLTPNRRQAIIWCNDNPVHCRIYMSQPASMSWSKRHVSNVAEFLLHEPISTSWHGTAFRITGPLCRE